MGARLKGAEDWVFDLDNTLYPAACDLFAQIDARMTDFVAKLLSVPPDEARAVQKKYYADHGTTLNGLMRNHGLQPADFLDYVHSIDLSVLPASPALKAAIERLPGRKFVFTNGSRGHAERVTAALGLEASFDGLFGIEDANYEPKPRRAAFDRFAARHKVAPARAVFFEDLSRNLETAHAAGYTTVLVHSEKDWSHEPAGARPAGPGDDFGDHVHYVTDDLTRFLGDALAFSSEPK
ncbi:MAG: pyrimidine 5'-nucleotidase [Pseudomonadota bacterium]